MKNNGYSTTVLHNIVHWFSDYGLQSEQLPSLFEGRHGGVNLSRIPANLKHSNNFNFMTCYLQGCAAIHLIEIESDGKNRAND